MRLFIVMIVLALMLSVDAVTYDLGNKFRPASATVEKKNGCFIVSCRFTSLKALRKNEARSAEYNDRRARELCMKALKLYMNIPEDRIMNVSGLTPLNHSAGNASEQEYCFSVPESGISSWAAVQKQEHNTPISSPEGSAPVQTAAASAGSGTAFRNLQTKTSFRMIRYKLEDGNVTIESSKNYTVKDFPDQSSFDKFCDKQFQIIANNSKKAFAELNRQFEEDVRRMRIGE